MGRKVFVLGTDHRFQMRSTDFADTEHQLFAAYVLDTLQASDVAAIAEENSPQALAEAGMAESTIQTIAREMGLKHRHCDPDRQTRMGLGIRQENEIRVTAFFEKADESVIQLRLNESMRSRECYWFAQLQELNIWPVLFICGANHSLPFAELLRANNVNAIIVAQDWGGKQA